MKKILFGTANKEKIRHVRHILSPFAIEILDPIQLGLKLDVTEDGDTPEKNAIKKAIAYYQTSGLPSFAIDSGLVINGLSNEEQPNVFVRRICSQDQEITDQQIIDHYIKKVRSVGGSTFGIWHSCIALFHSEATPLLHSWQMEVLFTSNQSQKTTPGAPLNSIMCDPDSRCYFSDMAYINRPDSRVIMSFFDRNLDKW
ncbi:MAG: hypothetical protein OXG87_10630 [Gemmatimonadetes bacterium]|nr:hypothetical protein [Gemmatimonadota bacterium]